MLLADLSARIPSAYPPPEQMKFRARVERSKTLNWDAVRKAKLDPRKVEKIGPLISNLSQAHLQNEDKIQLNDLKVIKAFELMQYSVDYMSHQ